MTGADALSGVVPGQDSVSDVALVQDSVPVLLSSSFRGAVTDVFEVFDVFKVVPESMRRGSGKARHGQESRKSASPALAPSMNAVISSVV